MTTETRAEVHANLGHVKAEQVRLLVEEALLAGAEIRRRLASDAEFLSVMEDVANLLVAAFRNGAKLLLCGNGGSAADCQHMAAELVSRLHREVDRPALGAVALTTDTSFLTAYANDCGYAGVFARQVEALGRPGDVLLGISTSGSSENVVRAMQAAAERGLKTVALVGRGGRVCDVADLIIRVPSEDTQRIQEAHLAIEHILCELVERSLPGLADS